MPATICVQISVVSGVVPPLAVGDTIINIPLLKDTLDMLLITKLINKSPRREAELRKQEEFLGQMERDFHVYDMDSPTLKILCPTQWTLQAASMSDILKDYETLMKLWEWAQDNASDSDEGKNNWSAD